MTRTEAWIAFRDLQKTTFQYLGDPTIFNIPRAKRHETRCRNKKSLTRKAQRNRKAPLIVSNSMTYQTTSNHSYHTGVKNYEKLIMKKPKGKGIHTKIFYFKDKEQATSIDLKMGFTWRSSDSRNWLSLLVVLRPNCGAASVRRKSMRHKPLTWVRRSRRKPQRRRSNRSLRSVCLVFWKEETMGGPFTTRKMQNFKVSRSRSLGPVSRSLSL